VSCSIRRHCATSPCGSTAPVSVRYGAIVSHGLESFRLEVGLKGGLDRAHGFLSGFVAASERAEGDAFSFGLSRDDLAVLNASRDETHGHAGLSRSIGVVFAGDR